jgi:heme A synthase
VADSETIAHWKTAGLFLAILLGGAVLGTLVAMLVLAFGGMVIRMPGVLALLDRFLTADFDAPLLWVLMVSSWLLGIVFTYVLVMLMLRLRRNGSRS